MVLSDIAVAIPSESHYCQNLMLMTDRDLAEIESKLKIALPNEYRDLILTHAETLHSCGCFSGDLPRLFLDPAQIIEFNITEKLSDSGTEDAFPNWWREFVLIGTNGAGDYFCLRLDGTPGVWMIGSDCGDESSLMAVSLRNFVDEAVRQHEEEQKREDSRHALFQDEVAAEMQAVAEGSDPKAKQWLEASTPYVMFELLGSLGARISPRKMRLFGIACCALIDNLPKDDDCVRAVQLAEQIVAGVAISEDEARLRSDLKDKYLAIVKGEQNSAAGLWGVGAAKNLLQEDDDYLKAAPIYAGDADLSRVWYAANSATSCDKLESFTDLLREVLGNPFHAVKFEPRWRAPATIALARDIYDTQAFSRMPSLGQALIDVGCSDERILTHCRRITGHVRGCWVLDFVLRSEQEP